MAADERVQTRRLAHRRRHGASRGSSRPCNGARREDGRGLPRHCAQRRRIHGLRHHVRPRRLSSDPPGTGTGACTLAKERVGGRDVEELRDELVRSLRYFDGHSDTLGLFADADFLRRVGAALAAPFRDARVDKVAGIEARGFVLAALVAVELRAGFVAVRKPGSIHPGAKAELEGPPDWRGQITRLRVQRHALAPGERVLIVDDWAETGSKALTTRRLMEECGGQYVGLSLLVDQLPDDVRDGLEPVARVVFAREVPG